MVRKVAVAVIGWSVVAVGVSMIVLPGPAILVIPLGLAILATEFAWAGRLFRRLKARVWQMRRGVPGWLRRSAASSPDARASQRPKVFTTYQA